MAESHLPVQPSAGWASGPSANVEEVDADEVRRNDRLVLDDAVIAVVTDVHFGDYWLTTGKHGYGVAISWRQADGTASGTLFRACGDMLHRIGP